MKPEKQINEIFQELGGVSNPTKRWVAQIIGYSATADRMVQPSETPYLMALFQILRSDPELAPVLQEIIRSTTPPPMESVNISAKASELIFRCVLDICTSDQEIQAEEYAYINQVGTSLGLSRAEVHQRVNAAVRNRIKTTFFRQLLRALDSGGRYWVAVMVFKIINRCGENIVRDPQYVKDIQSLLHNDNDRLELVKADAQNKTLEELPNVRFDKDTSTSLLTYLLEILCSDGAPHGSGWNLIRDIAGLLNFELKDLEELINTVRSEVVLDH